MSRQGLSNHKLGSENSANEIEIIRCFHKHNGLYGQRRIKFELAANGITVSRRLISKVLNRNNLIAHSGRTKKWRRRKAESEYTAEYLAKNKRDCKKFLELVCADITELKCHRGKLYISGIIDVASRLIVGIQISRNIKQEIVTDAIKDMFGRYGKPQMYHCDRGTQYTALRTKELLTQNNIRISMSRPGSPNDNQYIESFWHTLKKEMGNIGHMPYAQARFNVLEYIRYYNTRRIHSGIEYKTPQEMKVKLKQEVA